MYKDEYLFLPEAKTVDKLLSVFNIQSQQQLAPNEVISILGLLNLLNLVGIAQEGVGLSKNSLNSLVTKSESINEQQIQETLQQLNKNSSQNNLLKNLTDMFNSNQSGSALENLFGMIGENNRGNNSLDPTLMLKLMNLVNQIKENKSNKKEEQQEANNPVKSEPYSKEDDQD
ncbi:hypothetical protein BX659_1518 [Orenia metallireducens]|uniref:Uncharacterized protein n=1 Tax=Orenia metallireducens TaxID=1413210 RepID=A0A285IK10_9FIRM|nr:hypothetical protein [Orenia metallireducens]PRX17489.1 hypothetical protein BX659_1518 [Orenia metallireducens]SNY47416.1 hypothetical protein SAMN06265827_1512 [Orenia metallireducens]